MTQIRHKNSRIILSALYQKTSLSWSKRIPTCVAQYLSEPRERFLVFDLTFSRVIFPCVSSPRSRTSCICKAADPDSKNGASWCWNWVSFACEWSQRTGYHECHVMRCTCHVMRCTCHVMMTTCEKIDDYAAGSDVLQCFECWNENTALSVSVYIMK